MCGIFGVINVATDAGLETCAKTLTHRGPDAFGSYYRAEEKIYLAHCRLAIIDLSDAGRQPMSNSDGDVWLTFNGEIYNFKELRTELESCGHVFRSNSDSEVIIYAYVQWGSDGFAKLEGMFAFGLWDARNKMFFLVRDRVGIKPLYYLLDGEQLAFASEPKALIRLPGYSREVNAEALQSYLIYSYVAGEDSIWNGVKRLQPGSILSFDLARPGISTSQYWAPKMVSRKRGSMELLEEFSELFRHSVQGHLISDVPVGVFLSGGIDSTAVASMAASLQSGIQTLSMGFSDPERDELMAAQQTAEQIGANFHQAHVSLDKWSELQKVFNFLDEPNGDCAIFPSYLLSQEARKNVKVVLAGDGGDELFGGYSRHFYTVNARLHKKLMFRVGDMLGPKITNRFSTTKRLDKLQHYLFLSAPGFSLDEIQSLFPSSQGKNTEHDEAYLYRKHFNPLLEPFKSLQAVDYHTYLIDNNLAKLDRMSMACSLEVRVPLLDHKIVEFAFSLSDEQCVGKDGKSVLREYLRAQGLLHVLNKPKRGFSFTVNELWPIKEMQSILLASHMIRDGFMDECGVQKLIRASDAYNYSFKLWLLAVLEMWYRKWMA